MNFPLLLVGSLAAPLVLIPIEQVLPWPEVIEETVKLAGVFLLAKTTHSRKKYFLSAWLLAVVFALSETMLYLANIFLLGNLDDIARRLVFTTALHLATVTILSAGVWIGREKKWTITLFFISAVLLHIAYNDLIVEFFR